MQESKIVWSGDLILNSLHSFIGSIVDKITSYLANHKTRIDLLMKKIMFLSLLLFSNIVFAFDTIRINDKILSVGDTRQRMQEIAGTPNGTAQIFNHFGAEVGQRYIYYVGRKTITFDIKAEKIIRITEVN